MNKVNILQVLNLMKSLPAVECHVSVQESVTHNRSTYPPNLVLVWRWRSGSEAFDYKREIDRDQLTDENIGHEIGIATKWINNKVAVINKHNALTFKKSNPVQPRFVRNSHCRGK